MQIKKLIITILLGLLVTAKPGFAEFSSRYSNWAGVDIGGPFVNESKWHYDVMNQARIPNDSTRLEQYFFRPSVYYQLDQNWSLWLGYDLIYENPKNESSAIEQRVWPQIEYDKKFSPHLAISLRSRLENRWLSNQPSLAVRFRQRLELSFINWNKYNISFDTFDELFLGVRKPTWVTDRTIDQNRVFLGFVIPLNKVLYVDTGYLNVFRPRSPNNSVEHILVIALAINIGDREPIPIRTV